MRRPLLAIVVIAFALRLAYAARSGALRHPQVWEQERIATNLVERHEYVWDPPGRTQSWSYVEPMYPFLAAAVYLATDHDQTVLVLVQLLMAAATVWMTARATRLATGDDLTAIAAALLMAVHPGFIRYSSVLHPLVLDAFFFIAAAAALIRYRHAPTLRRGLAAAAVIGLGSLTRPTILLFLAPLCWIAWRSRDSIGERVLRAASVAVLALAILAPWTIRNAIVQHTFILTRSGTGYVFWLGHNPLSTGSARDAHFVELDEKAPPELRQRILSADELTRDRIYTEAAWDYIRARPLAAIGRVLQRVYYFWWFSPQWGAAFSPALKIIYRAWWAFLLVLMAIGLFRTRHAAARHDLWLMACLALLISLGQSVYYVEGRHRLAIEPLVLPLAACVLFRASPSVVVKGDAS
ncbi:MAG TPA: glycosyltransferase family 39 protein [Thermoanaerobaculia bacterium]|nr:glycosyltransferase family 39 protein [Thermoanaerobaculia bacterium]